MPKRIDITGKRFGKLTAIEIAKSRGKKTYWWYLCDCGRKKEVQTGHLTSGAITSCGLCEGNKRIDNFIKDKSKLLPRTCILCEQEFTPNVFNRTYCYDCVPVGLAPIERQKLISRLLKHKLVEYKGRKCEQCGYNKCEGALHFHHTDPNKKDFSISQINLNQTIFSIREIKKEVDKCILLCANCHAEKHFFNELKYDES